MKRVAIFTPGGVAREDVGVHIPSLYRLIVGLSDDFEIVVFSLLPFQQTNLPTFCGKAQVRYLFANPTDHWLKKVFLWVRTFAAEHRKKKFDIVHAMLGLIPEFSAIISARLYSLPAIVSFFGGETDWDQQPSKKTLRAVVLEHLTRLIVRNATTLTLLTDFQRNELIGKKIQHRDIKIIPHGIDTTIFMGIVKRSAKEPYHLLNIANIAAVKDQRILLKSLQIVCREVQCVLRIVGADYLDGSLQHFAESLNIRDRVEFYGFIPYQQIPEHLSWADVLVHSSRHEGQGVIFVEAAASKTPIVSTRVGLAFDLDSKGILASTVGDPHKLARNILKSLVDPVTVQEQIDLAFQWAQDHPISWTVSAYKALYNITFHP
jgi:glycosyltransferase involved in cell wall biosynthesis